MAVFSTDERARLKRRDPTALILTPEERLDDHVWKSLDGRAIRITTTTVEWAGSSNTATRDDVPLPERFTPAGVMAAVQATETGNEERYLATAWVDGSVIKVRVRSVVGSPSAATEATVNLLLFGEAY